MGYKIHSVVEASDDWNARAHFPFLDFGDRTGLEAPTSTPTFTINARASATGVPEISPMRLHEPHHYDNHTRSIKR